MISLLLSLVLGILVLVCLVLKLTGHRSSRQWDRVICVIIPIICVLIFLIIIVEASVRRNTNARELEKLQAVVELSLNSDRVFTSTKEKNRCLDSLKLYAAHVSAIAYDDSLISLVAGRDSCMQRRIVQTEHAVSQSIKWISRLNDLYKGDIANSQKELDDGSIKLIGPGSDKTTILNLAFKVKKAEEQTVCAYVQVLSSGKTTYSQAFEYKTGINCFNIPSSNQPEEIVELGYIYQSDNKKIFKYITYAR
ncbi:MAG: hypothetical protein ACI3ZD_00850 [Prevotella sp.]